MDVVIVCGPNDSAVLSECISRIHKYVKNLRRVIVVSRERYYMGDDAEYFEESRYPFTIKDINGYCYPGREGWIYQQLLKMHCLQVIPDITDKILVVDCDVMFSKEISFIQEDGKAIITTATEYNIPYFEHAARLLPGIRRVDPEISGVCHHNVFDKVIMDDLFSRVEKHHGKVFWKAFIEQINPSHFSGAGEPEIYYNFALDNFPDRIVTRKLFYIHDIYDPTEYSRKDEAYYICLHHYRRPENWRDYLPNK